MKRSNPLKDKQLVRTKVINRVNRLESLLPKTPMLDMDGSAFDSSKIRLNSKDRRIERRLWDITKLNRHGDIIPS